MTAVFEISDPRAIELAQALARQLGVSETEAVIYALEKRIAEIESGQDASRTDLAQEAP